MSSPQHSDPSCISQTVADFLSLNGFGEYIDMFEANGFEDVEDVMRLSDSDLLHLGVEKMGHRKKILRLLDTATHGVTEESKSPHMTPEDRGLSLNIESEKPNTRRRSNTYTPSSPKVSVRTRPRHQYSGNRIIVELIAGKLEVEGKLYPQVKMSVCKTVNTRGVPIDDTMHRSSVKEGDQPSWFESFEFPAALHEGYYLVFSVNNKKGFSWTRIGLVAIPMKFFLPFTDTTVVDNWFPLKLGPGKRTGELHLKLRVPGGAPSQIGKAFKVTGVKMETRKLIVEVVSGELMSSSKSTYVKLALPNKEEVCRETKVQKDTKHPKWNEAFEFFTEVKNAQYLLVKLKHNKLMQHKTLGICKIPLLFYLSLKEKHTVDNWFECSDSSGLLVGKVHLRMVVMARAESEKGMVKAPSYGFQTKREKEQFSAPKLSEVMKNSNEVSPQRIVAEEEEEEEEPEDGEWEVDDHQEDFAPYSPTKPKESGGVFWPPPAGQRMDSSLIREVAE